MNKMCLAHLGALLLALHLISSQVVQAKTMPNATSISANGTGSTTLQGNCCGMSDAFTLLLPLAVLASLLHGWS